jgi:hypothetical protein
MPEGRDAAEAFEHLAVLGGEGCALERGEALELHDLVVPRVEGERDVSDVGRAEQGTEGVGTDPSFPETPGIDATGFDRPQVTTLGHGIRIAQVRREVDAPRVENQVSLTAVSRLLSIASLLALPCVEARAQSLADAETLPKNTGGLIINPGFGYGPGALQRFGRGWQIQRESLVADFDDIDLTTVIAGDEGDTIARLVGKLGTTSFEAKQTAFAVNFFAAYGITDRLTVAALLPFMAVRYELDAALIPFEEDPSDPTDDDFFHSYYTVKNAEQLTCPGGSFDITDPASLIGGENALLEDGRDRFGPNYQFNIADLNRALGSDCLGYRQPIDRTETRDGVVHGIGERTFAGFRDMALAAKYQLLRHKYIHLGLIGYVILPTGKPDKPEDLFDFKFGDGNAGAALLGAYTIPIGNFQMGGSIGYEWEFADSIEIRLNNITFSDELETQLATGQITEEQLFERHLDDASLVPIVTRYDQVRVERKLGDNIYVYTSFGYKIFDWLSVGLTVNFLHHFRDEIREIGARPEGTPRYLTEAEVRGRVAAMRLPAKQHIETLKQQLGETDGRKKAAYGWRTVRGNLDVGFGITFNAIPLFLRGDFPVPIIIGLGINRFIAGQNLDTPEAISLQIALPFVTSLDIVDPAEYGYDNEEGGGLPFP